MSVRASAYAKALIECPNGELITRGEKLVLIVLADAHQDKAGRFTYPSLDTIAPEAMCDRRTCQRYLASLERKGVIRRMRPPKQGRGMSVFYFFEALDEMPEGWQPAALFEGKTFAQKGGKRAAEGRQKGGKLRGALIERAREREPEQEQKPTPQPPSPAKGEQKAPADAAETVEQAAGRVMAAMGMFRRRDKRHLQAQIEQRSREGSPGEIADAMIAEHRRKCAEKSESAEARAERLEREGWAIWSTASEAFQAANPWTGRRFDESPGG